LPLLRNESDGSGQMTDDKPQPSDPPDLGEFSDRLRRAKGHNEPPPGSQSGVNSRGLGMAFRMATEMVAALLVGGAIGWFLDRWWGTRPWLLLVFLALGMAAGILNVFRAAQRMAQDETGQG
jgi:ATP synthase protein I